MVEESINDVLSKPITKNPFTVMVVFQLFIIIYIICESAINLIYLLKFGSFSFIDLIKIVIDLLLISGFVFGFFAYYTENDGLLKNAYLIFVFGCMGLLILIVFDYLKNGFSFGSLIKFFVYFFIMYCFCLQARKV